MTCDYSKECLCSYVAKFRLGEPVWALVQKKFERYPHSEYIGRRSYRVSWQRGRDNSLHPFLQCNDRLSFCFSRRIGFALASVLCRVAALMVSIAKTTSTRTKSFSLLMKACPSAQHFAGSLDVRSIIPQPVGSLFVLYVV